MALRKVLTAIMVMVMAFPAWGSTEPLGSITSSVDATVRDTNLTSGSTVYNGDAISVGERGAVEIAFAGGSQAEVIGNSKVRMAKSNGKIQMAVDQGQASFRTSGKSGMEALVSDVTIRPADEYEALGVIQELSETHAIVAARKGTLLITTPSNGMTYTVHEGEAADLSASDDPQGGAIPAGKAAPGLHKKKVVIWTVVIIASLVALTAYLLIRNEVRHPATFLELQISPTKID